MSPHAGRNAIVYLTLCLSVASYAAGQEEDDRVEQRASLLKQMQAQAEKTKVELVRKEKSLLKLHDKPVFRYDDQPRRLVDATVWAWLDNGRPVAFQKVEALDRDSPEWQFCFTSFAEASLRVRWGDDKSYQAKEAGVTYQAISDAPPVATRTTERRRQLRELARAFSARIVPDGRIDDSQEMRLLTTPLLEYDDADTKLLAGAVFGYSTNGTNPDLLIAFEARTHKDKTAWYSAPARMTIGGITVKHRERVIWECPFVEPGQHEFATWTYFQTRREPPAKP